MYCSIGFTPNTKAESAKVNDNFQELSDAILPTPLATVVGTLVTGTSVTPILPITANLTIIKVYLIVKTAPTGAALIVDVNKNGTSIWNVTPANRVQIAAGATTGNQTSFDTSQLSDGDYLTFDIDFVDPAFAPGPGTPEVVASAERNVCNYSGD